MKNRARAVTGGSRMRTSPESRPSAVRACDLVAQLEALPDQGGDLVQDLRQVAAGLPLDHDRGGEKSQVLQVDAAAEI